MLFASELVPNTDVVPALIGEVITGVADCAWTVTEFETVEIAFPSAVAFAVTTLPSPNAVTVFVHAPPETVTVPPVAVPSR